MLDFSQLVKSKKDSPKAMNSIRNSKLSAKKRKEIAQKAARARWGKRKP
jgi:hypothetical protein